MKTKYLLMLFMGISLLISCSQDNEMLEIDNLTTENITSNRIASGETDDLIVDLMAGQNIDSGSVTVSDVDGFIDVTYQTEGDWEILEVHLFVGDENELPTNNAGYPQIDEFPYSETYGNGTTNVNFSDIFSITEGECVWVVAHALVVNSVSGQEESAWAFGEPINNENPSSGQIYTSVQNGKWNHSSTWDASGVPPIDLGNGDVVNINHKVKLLETLKMSGNAILNNNHILKIPNGNLEIENEDVIVNINNALVIIVNGLFLNKSGTVNFLNGGVQLCDDGYKDESDSPNGTFGTGYIYALNGNIESLGSGNFSDLINWCSVNGNGVNLPIAENCPLVTPPNGCQDESFYTVNDDGSNWAMYFEVCNN